MADEVEAPKEEPKEAGEEDPAPKISKYKEKKEIDEAINKMTEAYDTLQKKIDEANTIKAEDMLGGIAEAGKEVKTKNEEDKIQEEADKIMDAVN